MPDCASSSTIFGDATQPAHAAVFGNFHDAVCTGREHEGISVAPGDEPVLLPRFHGPMFSTLQHLVDRFQFRQCIHSSECYLLVAPCRAPAEVRRDIWQTLPQIHLKKTHETSP